MIAIAYDKESSGLASALLSRIATYTQSFLASWLGLWRYISAEAELSGI